MPDSLEPPTWGAPSNMGCIAAGTTATAGKYGRHVPFSYHLGVPFLSIHVLGLPHNPTVYYIGLKGAKNGFQPIV